MVPECQESVREFRGDQGAEGFFFLRYRGLRRSFRKWRWVMGCSGVFWSHGKWMRFRYECEFVILSK